MQTAANRMKAITTIQNAVADCEKHKAVHDKYIKIGWKIRKEAYAESHKDELTAFNKALRDGNRFPIHAASPSTADSEGGNAYHRPTTSHRQQAQI